MDDRCPVKAPHMHCPLCVKTDAYQDPVILKAHYRVKHVDKGIDFAGKFYFQMEISDGGTSLKL